MESAGWQVLVVRVPLDEDYERGVRNLQALQAWLADNHRPVTLFRADGKPRSEAVCFAVPAGMSDKALAWRTFCNGLGLTAGMAQWRVAPYRPAAHEPPFAMELE
jgi:hypothetical protein